MSERVATTLPFEELPVAIGNFDTSRKPIDRVVIHTMAGTWQGATARFNNPTQKVSAHYGVKLDGGLIHWLEENYTAYHSGNYAMNQRSIGIEHEDGGDYNGVRPDALYEASAKLVYDICTFYGIPMDRSHILKHSEVKATACPDALDIDRIIRQAIALTPPPPPPPLTGLDLAVGYKPDHLGQTVTVHEKTYQSVEINGELQWQIVIPKEPESVPETPTEPQTPIVEGSPLDGHGAEPMQSKTIWELIISFLSSLWTNKQK